ncbi:hypothetical protein TSUD_214820 [Trifolium subterraneum]|uniref:Uncharacterized protein n=1 Tax=Trifolium subterraneum TaxID=3900 RepID=A0A2Z6ME76_TRISU|nr:hypothetical protein TSUD_214820 [Trifolium subterraneum]
MKKPKMAITTTEEGGDPTMVAHSAKLFGDGERGSHRTMYQKGDCRYGKWKRVSWRLGLAMGQMNNTDKIMAYARQLHRKECKS